MLNVNVSARAKMIQTEVDQAIARIQFRAESGIAVTDILFPKDIFRECRQRVNEFMEENSVEYVWLAMGGYFISDYDEDHYLLKFKLKQ